MFAWILESTNLQRTDIFPVVFGIISRSSLGEKKLRIKENKRKIIRTLLIIFQWSYHEYKLTTGRVAQMLFKVEELRRKYNSFSVRFPFISTFFRATTILFYFRVKNWMEMLTALLCKFDRDYLDLLNESSPRFWGFSSSSPFCCAFIYFRATSLPRGNHKSAT